MTKERQGEHDPYWQVDQAIGEGRLDRKPTTIRLRVHISEEQYRESEDLIPLEHRGGKRTYFLARPYILEPQITLTVGLYPRPSPDEAIGEALSSAWEGMRQREIGNAQAWYYHLDRVMILWECYLFEPYRQASPFHDETLTTVWEGFERLLLERLPEAQRIVTPSWEDIYGRSLWQDFLRAQGYSRLNERALAKEVAAK